MARKFLTPVGLPSGASNPATGSAGDLFYNTSDGFIYNHNGTSWSQIVGDGMPAGGTTGQLLTKVDGTNYNTQWVDQTSIETSTVKHLVKNDSGVTLSKGTVVYTKSANGTNILVDKAIATNDTYSSQVLGFLESDLAANETGYCVNNGLVTNINTDGATAGDPVWLSGTTAGGFVTGAGNKPVAPTHLVYLGVVTRANSSTGEIFVHISNGWELDELHNVLIDGTPADNEVLAYDSGSSIWKNQTAAEANLSVVGHTHSIANVTSLQTSLDAKANLAGASFTGNISTTGDANVAGKLSITASSGDEGGEIFLSNAVTNTSITNGVTIDVYQNKLRFFEQGGDARGYYVDITGGGAAASTNLVGGASASNSFATIATPSGTNPVADSSTDTLTLTAGTGISITGDATADSIAIATNGASANGASTLVLRDSTGNFSANVVTASTFSGSGASLTNIPGANVTGTLTSTVLGNSTAYVGTTAVALNRASANQGLTGISSVTFPGSTSGTIQLLANATAGTGTVVTLPATTGTVVTTGDSGTVTNTMLAGSIANAKLANTAVSLGAQTLTLGAAATTTISGMTSVSSSTLTSTVATGTAPFTVTSTTQVTNLKAEFAGTADLANAVAVGNVSGLGANVATFLATPSSANLLNVMTTETGTGNLVFSTNPSLDGMTLNAGTSFIIEDADSVVGRVIGSGNLFYIQAGADSNDSTGHIFMGRYANANPVANITLNATTTNVATNLRVGNDLTMVGSATLRTGASTAGDAPLYFASGTNLSAIEAGAVEYDGNVFYGTPKVTSTTYGRGLIPTTMVYSNNTSPTTSTSTGGATITLNPLGTAVTLPAGSFEVEGFVVVQVSSTVNPASTLRFGFTGTGVASMLFDEKYNANQAALTTIAAPTNGARTSVGTVSLVSNPTSGYYTRAWFKGIIRTSSTATFYPIFTVVNGSTPATVTLTAQPDGFMKVTPLNGTYTAAVNIGGWA